MIRPRFKHLQLRHQRRRSEPVELPESMAEVLAAQQAANEAVVADVQALAVFLEARRAVRADDVVPALQPER